MGVSENGVFPKFNPPPLLDIRVWTYCAFFHLITEILFKIRTKPYFLFPLYSRYALFERDEIFPRRSYVILVRVAKSKCWLYMKSLVFASTRCRTYLWCPSAIGEARSCTRNAMLLTMLSIKFHAHDPWQLNDKTLTLSTGNTSPVCSTCLAFELKSRVSRAPFVTHWGATALQWDLNGRTSNGPRFSTVTEGTPPRGFTGSSGMSPDRYTCLWWPVIFI